jgi:hypothetical protein
MGVEALSMKIRYLVPITGLLLALALVAGCTQVPVTPPVRTTVLTTPQTPTLLQTTAPPTGVATTGNPPGPVQTLPRIYTVEVQVDSNGLSIDPKIITTFRGGPGINFVTQIDVILTRDDGVIKTGTLTQPLSVGQMVELPSTTGNNNQVEVYVTLSTGDRYKIFNETVPFRAFH